MKKYKTLSFDAVVIGTGAAGYNAAIRLAENNVNAAIVTEGISCGTSRNTGSDKQTYYKLGLSGSAPDSVRAMAENLFSCGAVDGDTALCEAALSVRSFMRLCELGVEFPCNRYGEYVGYKTDHDPFARATSAGPLTSKYMTEVLEKRADELKIPVLNGFLAVEILKNKDGVCGLICLEKANGGFTAINCANIILATGGPAGIYADSVYPSCHNGSTGLAVAAGVPLQNMTEWQYGLASVDPRWNVSGTYMQVLPRMISVGEDKTENEFLLNFYGDPYSALSALFLKGYQWPFDSGKVLSGSSVIDLLVYRECVIKKRRVFLDYRKNPFGIDKIDYSRLLPEAYDYLKNAEACFGTPIERLMHMNAPAAELYKSKGLDLAKEPLEIALCAQHNNGGISVDCWWQTPLKGLFAAGECAGTHGITRPGGSALNSGQVGSLRAALYISAHPRAKTQNALFLQLADMAVKRHAEFCEKLLSNWENVDLKICEAQRNMSDGAAAIRDAEIIKPLLESVTEDLKSITETTGVNAECELYKAYRLYDILLVQQAVLTAMLDFEETVGKTRGSALYRDKNGELRNGLEELFRFCPDKTAACNRIQTVSLINGQCKALWRGVRPMPDDNDFFETVWRGYRDNKNIY